MALSRASTPRRRRHRSRAGNCRYRSRAVVTICTASSSKHRGTRRQHCWHGTKPDPTATSFSFASSDRSTRIGQRYRRRISSVRSTSRRSTTTRSTPTSNRLHETSTESSRPRLLDIPRTGTVEEIAERLECAASTASRHLRKAERALVTSFLK
ncbi:MAG: helix-turn-helix domain-containing protein [Halapricum sp.]